jgi:hypothetical protein
LYESVSNLAGSTQAATKNEKSLSKLYVPFSSNDSIPSRPGTSHILNGLKLGSSANQANSIQRLRKRDSIFGTSTNVADQYLKQLMINPLPNSGIEVILQNEDEKTRFRKRPTSN